MLKRYQLDLLNSGFPPGEVTAYYPRVPKASKAAEIMEQRKKDALEMAAHWRTEGADLSGAWRYNIDSYVRIVRSGVAPPIVLAQGDTFVYDGIQWGRTVAGGSGSVPHRDSVISPSVQQRQEQARAARGANANAVASSMERLLGGRY